MNQTITLPLSMLKRLDKISEGSHVKPEAIIKQAITDRLDYEEWLLEQVDAGLAEFKAGKGIPHEEFLKRVGVSQNARKKAA
jgi:predicted transcriptional regulator